ncbi:MAG: hypothetical protein ACRDQH_08010 [Pseudonocardiaceae bacterium]
MSEAGSWCFTIVFHGHPHPPAPPHPYRHNQHLLRDLDGAAQIYPDAVWPTQIADALRGLIQHANLAREQGLDAIAQDIQAPLLSRFRHGVLDGLSDTLHRGTRPGENKARCVLEVLRDRPTDVLRFAHDLQVPLLTGPNAICGPANANKNTSGRLTSENAPRTATPSEQVSVILAWLRDDA